jgi:hypothetical protein
MTTLMEELRLAVQEILQSIGLGGSANTVATVVPVLMLGIVLNVIALSLVDRVHPLKGKMQVAGVVRAEARYVQSMTVCLLRQIEGRHGGTCSAGKWTLSRLAEKGRCRITTSPSRAVVMRGNGFAVPCAGRNSMVDAGKTLQTI